MTISNVGVMTNGRAATRPGTLGGMPNQPKTPMKSFRIPQDLYDAAKDKAAERGESLSDVVRRAFERYVRSKR